MKISKKMIIIPLAALLIVGLVACAAPEPAPTVTVTEPAPSPEQKEELPKYRLKGPMLLAAPQIEELGRTWAKELKESLAGIADVEMEFYLMGELVPSDQEFRSLQAGSLDMGMIVGPWAGAPIDMVVVDSTLAFAWMEPMDLHVMMRRGLKDLFAESYEEPGGVKYVGWGAADPVNLFSNRPIEKYEDIKGLRIFSVPPVVRPLEEAGGISAEMAYEEVYLAVETGQLDAIAICGTVEAYTTGFHDIAPYMLSQRLTGACLHHWIFNKELWESFPAEMQSTIEMAVESFALREMTYFTDGQLSHKKYFNVTTLPDEDFEKLFEGTYEHWDMLAQKSPRVAEAVRIFKQYNEERSL